MDRHRCRRPGRLPPPTGAFLVRSPPVHPDRAGGCGPRVVIHVHVTDQTLIEQHGVVRTEHGPITLDQFRQWLTQADPIITIRPVLDPAATAAVDAYEIPQRLRQAMTVRHPGSVWPFSPATTIRTGGRLDLDHTIPHTTHGPPGQTVAGQPRTAHPDRAPGQDPRWMAGPTTRPRHLPVAITRRTGRGHHQPRHPPARRPPLGPPGLAHTANPDSPKVSVADREPGLHGSSPKLSL